jgi:rubrerythrin
MELAEKVIRIYPITGLVRSQFNSQRRVEMHAMTEEFLKAAFAGESQAHMKYLAFADKADKEGKPNIANLFRAIAYAERVHAINHLKALGGIGNTGDNLVAAKGGEDFEVDEMYAAYLPVAEMQGEKGAHRSMTFAIEAEKIHSTLYEAAKAAVDAGEDIAEAKVWICPVCGFTALGDDVPDRCPVCNVLKKMFCEFDA